MIFNYDFLIMDAIEFITTPSNNTINIPSKYSNLNNHNIRVVILQDDIECVSDEEQGFYEEALSSLSNDDKKISSSKTFSL